MNSLFQLDAVQQVLLALAQVFHAVTAQYFYGIPLHARKHKRPEV